MINTITQSEFTAAFHNMDRGNNFTHQGLIALYDYLTGLEEEWGVTIELDVIALCCDFCEYNDLEECLEEYSNLDLRGIEHLRDYTTVIEMSNGGIIIQSF